MTSSPLAQDSPIRGVAAVVLAAGESSRMGRPKATLPLCGSRFVDRIVAAARQAGCAPILVVHGAHLFDAPAGSVPVANPLWRLGPLSSLQAGLARLLADANAEDAQLRGVLVCPVDRPRVRSQTLITLLEAHAGAPDLVWQPRHEGRHGHPVLWPAGDLAALMALDATDPQTSARTLLHSPNVRARRRFVDLDDPSVVENLDTPEDLEGLS